MLLRKSSGIGDKEISVLIVREKKAEPKPPPKPEEIYTRLIHGGKSKQEYSIRASGMFWRTTLKALSEKMPKTYDELLQIPGIKEKKRDKYGKSVLKVLDQFRS